MDEHHHIYISLVLGHIFKDNEGICISDTISTTMPIRDLNTGTLVALLTENQPVLEVG